MGLEAALIIPPAGLGMGEALHLTPHNLDQAMAEPHHPFKEEEEGTTATEEREAPSSTPMAVDTTEEATNEAADLDTDHFQ